MITGSHIVVYSRDAEADRAFARDVLGFDSVDAGDGWLIFALPPAELSFHSAEESDEHELYLVCSDLEATMAELAEHKVVCGDPVEASWGVRTTLRLPGGGTLGLYESRHPTIAAGQ